MALTVGNDYLGFDNTETITYYVRTAPGSTFAPPITVPFALRRQQSKDDKHLAGLTLGQAGLHWHLWSSNLSGTIPKVGDVVQDGVGIRWTVMEVEVGTLATRYRLTCVKERS